MVRDFPPEKRRGVTSFLVLVLVLAPGARLWAQETSSRENRSDYLSDLIVEFEERVVESATIRPRRLILSPSTVTRLSGAEARRSGARFLTDAFRMASGVEVLRSTSLESNVNVRGYNDLGITAQGMLALVDGRPVYNDLFANAFWDALNVSMHELDHVEIIRGPGSFLYGTNAMHGVVSIKTRSPLDYERDVVSFSASGGGYRSSLASVISVRRMESSALKVTTTWDDIRDFEERDSGSRRKKSLKLHFEQELGDEHRVGISGGVLQQNVDVLVATLIGGLIPSAVFENDAQESFLNLDYRHGGFQGRLSWTAYDIETVATAVYPSTDPDLDTVDGDLRYTFEPFPNHELTVGLGYRVASVDTKNIDVSSGRRTSRIFSAYFEDDIQLGPRLELIVGLRLDRHSNSGEDFSPRAALVWEFLDQQALRFSYGVGVRTPSLRENYIDLPLDIGIPGVTLLSNRDLDAERVQSFELGYAGQPFGSVWARVTGFYNVVDNEIQTLATGLQAQSMNTGQQEAFGAELELDVPFTPNVSGFANYSYTHRRLARTNDRLGTGPRNKGNIGLDLAFFESWNARLWFHYFDETEFQAGKLREYSLLNGQLAYRFSLPSSGEPERDPDLPARKTQAEAFVRVFNLLDNRHREHPQGDKYGIIALAGVQIDW